MTKYKIFLEKSEIKHNHKYDYSLVEYYNNRIKVKIICPIHGEFEQRPDSHLMGKGCPNCSKSKKSDIFEFIEKSKIKHNDKYDYSLVEYKGSKNKVKIICPIHGEFEQQPVEHISGRGCRGCSNDRFKQSLDEFKYKSNLVHNDRYDYSLSEYINSTTLINIVCPEHGIFKQSPNNHISKKYNCPKCSLKYDKTEGELKDFIKSLELKFEENTRKIIPPLELDIYIPSHNIAIEFDGLYWHSELYKDNNYHLNKTNICEEKDIRLIHIFEDEWLYKQDIVKSRLINMFGLTSNKIYGRKTEIKNVSPSESKLFLNNNHIQGNVNAKYKLGLYYNNELVSLMTFGNLRCVLGSKQKDDKYELVRFCNKLNTNVIGGADKLLKHFVKTHQPKEIISYADRRWSQGDLYKTLGFSYTHKSKPNYFYIINKRREYRFKYRKNILIKNGFDSNKTEREIMLERGINRIYDCGTIAYIKYY
jgi:hypothetical protein